jgi:uncharacterized 2Fe-2S/4Fe-4S cluster protein (DUF4445 family)
MSNRVQIELEPLGQTITVERGTALRTVLHSCGVEFPCGGRGRCGGCRIRVTDGTLPALGDQAEILGREAIAEGWRLACRCSVETGVTLHVGQWETIILSDHSPFEFTPHEGLGVAVDLGTTTLVAQLLDLQSGRVLAVRSEVNPQTRHGSDVMSRIHTAVQEGQGAKLAEELRLAIGTLVSNLVASAPLEEASLGNVAIVGNTVMHHLFCGIDLEPLSGWPFETPEGGPRSFEARELAWNLSGNPAVRFLPSLGSFVGSDILAGVLATKMHENESPLILVDLGTNGEIIIGNRERMICASTAAGPAFEGGRITMGMRATTGAISEVTVEEGRLSCRVIGDVEPRGICGSGLVDAAAAALDLKMIQPSGRFTQPGRPLELEPPVTLSQGDIRQLQLAKAAIAAGFRILRKWFGVDACKEAPIYLAGAFGNYINRNSARRIGLLDAPAGMIRAAGNTALLGAKLALFTDDVEDQDFQGIRDRVEHISLAADPSFQETFVDEMAFPG